MNDSFSIRRAAPEDLPQIMSIYARARAFMAAHGNPHQWGDRGWPPQALIEKDIERGKSFLCERDGLIAAVFYYDFGPDIEPTYRRIDEGQWLSDTPYGVVHRIAASGRFRGAGRWCIDWALQKSGHLRIDTHGDNTVMQSLLLSLGFTPCGTIFVYEDNDPRIAYEKVLENGET